MLLLMLGLGAAIGAAPPEAPPAAAAGAIPPDDGVAATPPLQVAGSISDMDYPLEAIRANAQGTTGVRITVKPTGEVSGCVIERSSGHASLDAASCALVQTRFRYHPARTRSGAATSATVSRRIIWRLPEDGPGAPAMAAPPLNFTSGLLRVTFGGAPSERPRCAVETAGSTFEPVLPFQCFGFERVPPAGLAHAAIRVVSILHMQPEGFPAPPPLAVAGGALVAASAATIEVDPQGRIVGCTPVDAGSPVLPHGSQHAHVCDRLYLGMPAFVPLGGTANRRAAFGFQAYQVGEVTRPAT